MKITFMRKCPWNRLESNNSTICFNERNKKYSDEKEEEKNNGPVSVRSKDLSWILNALEKKQTFRSANNKNMRDPTFV